MTAFYAKTYGATVGVLLIAILIGSCDSQITDIETSIHNKATEISTEAPAFEDQQRDICLRGRDSEDYSVFKHTED